MGCHTRSGAKKLFELAHLKRVYSGAGEELENNLPKRCVRFRVVSVRKSGDPSEDVEEFGRNGKARSHHHEEPVSSERDAHWDRFDSICSVGAKSAELEGVA